MTWLVSLFLAGNMLVSGSGNLQPQPVRSAPETKAAVSSMQDETERFEQTYPFDPSGRIEVSNLNGAIKIEAWDSPQIRLEAVKTADSRERLADVEIKVEAGQSEFSVAADYKPWKDRVSAGEPEGRKYSKLSVDFKLMVPRTAVLKEIETVNGAVEVSNMTSYTEVSAVNGAVTGSNLSGTAKLSTVNGTVTADFENLSGDSTIALSTVNGTVKLQLPSATNATVKANSVNGGISNDFGLPVQKGKYVGRDLYGRIGNGDVKIRLSSVNGGISIGRKNDGGALNPVVDLLPQKTSDEFDSIFEEDFDIEVGRINRDMSRALAESAAKIEFSKREVEKAMKAVEATIAATAPEVQISAEALRAATAAIDRERLATTLDGERARIEAELARASEAFYMGRSPFIEEKSGQFEVSEKPKVTVDAKDCMVRVRGWDKQEVKYSVTRLKRNQGSSDVVVETSKNGKDVLIEIKGAGKSGPASSEFLDKVRVEVFVPKRSDLRIKSDGEVRLEGVTGDLELVGSKGSVNVRDSQGALRIMDAKGIVRVIGFEGDLSTRGVKGDLYLEGSFDAISSVEGSGNVFLTLGDDADAMITAGKVDFEDAVAVNDSTYRVGGVSVIKQDSNSWKVGNGTGRYEFQLEKGGLQIRPKSATFVD